MNSINREDPPANFLDTRPPLKVALLGAPGAGKTQVARKLKYRLETRGHGVWKIVDEYPEKLHLRAGVPYGPIFDRSAFRSNLQIAAERWTLEDTYQLRGVNTITCGTIFETIIYAAAQGIATARVTDEQTLLEEVEIAKIMMGSLGVLANLTFDYDCLLYLPSDNPTEWDMVVDAKLPEVLEGQFKQALVLRGTIKEKFTEAYDIINQIASALASDEQQAVRRGTDTGEGEEPRSEHVPDVSPEKN